MKKLAKECFLPSNNLSVKLYLTFLISLILLSPSCHLNMSNHDVIDDELLIDIPKSKLYIRVRGLADKPLIINLHGGPGGYSGIDIKLMGTYLEEHFLVAYLDQRGCGKSLACTDTLMLNVKQYIKDLAIVVDSLKNHYSKSTVNLMGTSWGGMYGFLYILSHPHNIGSFACIDGKVNSEYQNYSLINFELNKAKELLKSVKSKRRIHELNSIITELEHIRDHGNFEHFYKQVNWLKHKVPPKLGFNAYFADTSKIISFHDVLQDSALLKLMKYTKEEYSKIGSKAEIVNRAFRNNPDYNTINIENDLARIDIPTAVIQGDQDYVVGLGHADLIYNALTNLSPENKELHILPNTGHCPAIENPKTLSEILIHFFKKHN